MGSSEIKNIMRNSASPGGSHPPVPCRPNILLITNDEHRWDFFGGGAVGGLRTPAVDRLKSRGVTLTNAVSNCPVCMPTRFTWLTGLYASQSEIGPRNGKDWPHGYCTVAHALKRSGYHTALIGKLHSHSGRTLARHDLQDLEVHTKARGFDEVFEYSGRSLLAHQGHKGCRYTNYLRGKGLFDQLVEDTRSRDDRLGGKKLYAPSSIGAEDHFDAFVYREMERWVKNCSTEKPFFLHASFFGPHFPLDPPEPYFSRYRPEDMPPPAGVDDPKAIRSWQQQRAAYCGLIEFTDHWIGRLLDAFEARNLLDNSVILFTTDHGDMMGDHHLSHKMQPYDASVRTPVVVCDPWSKRSGGTVLYDMAEAADVPATILAAGSDEPLHEALPCSPGLSFLDYVRGNVESHRSWAYSEHGNSGEPRFWRMARTPEWKYIFEEKHEKLFDLKNDPMETNNLISQPDQQMRVSEMRAMLVQRMGGIRVAPTPL